MKRLQMDRNITQIMSLNGKMVNRMESLFAYIDRKHSDFIADCFRLIDEINTVILPSETKEELRDEFVKYTMEPPLRVISEYKGLKIVFMDNINDIGFAKLEFKGD